VNKDKLYFLNIHKNGGKVVHDKIINKVFNSLNGIPIETQNKGWAPVTDGTYVLSAFRHPVLRTVSHYFDHKSKEIANSNTSINEFAMWFDKNIDALSNYQLKNMFYDKPSDNNFLMDEDFKSLKLPVKMSEIKSRMRRFDAIFKIDNVRRETLIGISNDILKSFNRDLVPANTSKIEYNQNIHSRAFSLALPAEIKKEIELVNETEMNIYETNSFFQKFVIQ